MQEKKVINDIDTTIKEQNTLLLAIQESNQELQNQLNAVQDKLSQYQADTKIQEELTTIFQQYTLSMQQMQEMQKFFISEEVQNANAASRYTLQCQLENTIIQLKQAYATIVQTTKNLSDQYKELNKIKKVQLIAGNTQELSHNVDKLQQDIKEKAAHAKQISTISNLLQQHPFSQLEAIDQTLAAKVHTQDKIAYRSALEQLQEEMIQHYENNVLKNHQNIDAFDLEKGLWLENDKLQLQQVNDEMNEKIIEAQQIFNKGVNNIKEVAEFKQSLREYMQVNFQDNSNQNKIESMLSDMKVNIQDKKMEIQFETQSDPQLLTQLEKFFNLISNPILQQNANQQQNEQNANQQQNEQDANQQKPITFSIPNVQDFTTQANEKLQQAQEILKQCEQEMQNCLLAEKIATEKAKNLEKIRKQAINKPTADNQTKVAKAIIEKQKESQEAQQLDSATTAKKLLDARSNLQEAERHVKLATVMQNLSQAVQPMEIVHKSAVAKLLNQFQIMITKIIDNFTKNTSKIVIRNDIHKVFNPLKRDFRQTVNKNFKKVQKDFRQALKIERSQTSVNSNKKQI